ncbi:MAG: GMC family oxidoreductase [Pseudomonadales bacterium]|nr:GMC family oxidoreductase [Pseudomonadales bacterium]
MIQNSLTLCSRNGLKVPICIVGSGPVGISLALSLEEKGIPSTILEAGDSNATKAFQDALIGQQVGITTDALNTSRYRCIGGTSNYWHGESRPLNSSDFSSRPWIPNSGWPISSEDLFPYWVQTARYLRLDPNLIQNHDNPDFTNTVNKGLNTTEFSTTISQINPLNFRTSYYEHISQSSSINLIHSAIATELLTHKTTKAIMGVKVNCINRGSMEVTSPIVILACGGIENTRLLLNSKQQTAHGLGNKFDVVGRYYMQHVHEEVSELLLSQKGKSVIDAFQAHKFGDSDIRVNLLLNQETCKNASICNSVLMFNDYYQGENSPAFLQFRRLIGDVRNGRIPEDFTNSIAVVMANANKVLETQFRRSLELDRIISKTLVGTYAEHAPNHQSRVTLTSGKDKFGMPRISLDLKMQEIDRRSVLESQKALARFLGSNGLGRIKIDASIQDKSWPKFLKAGSHQLGGTRMHEDPRFGVVNSDCEVYGTKNLFIAGSSLFPTSGTSPPTIAAIALGLRLADFIQLNHH